MGLRRNKKTTQEVDHSKLTEQDLNEIIGFTKNIRYAHTRIEKLTQLGNTSEECGIRAISYLIDILNDDTHFALAGIEGILDRIQRESPDEDIEEE
jgi:hypothetical protein